MATASRPRSPFADAPIISVYTMKDGIENGLFKSVPDKLAKEAGYHVPVALTAEAWAAAVPGKDESSVTGQLWDVLFVLRHTIRAKSRREGDPGSEIRFHVLVRHGSRIRKLTLVAKMVAGDPTGNPYLLILLVDQD